MKEGLKIKSTHRAFYIVASIIILFLIGTSVYAALPVPGANAPNPGHSADQVYIKYGNNYVTFQHAVERRYLVNTSANVTKEISSSDPNNLPDNNFPKTWPWHYASQILIEMSGQWMTLQQAVDADNFAKGVDTSKNYTTKLPPDGQLGSQINVNISGNISTVQGIITAGAFLCKPFTASEVCGSKICGPTDNGCRGTVSCGTAPTGYHCSASQTAFIFDKAGQSCVPSGKDSRCVSGFTYQNDGSCTGGSYPSGNQCNYQCSSSSLGSSCGYVANYYCNGAGSCVYVAPTSSGGGNHGSTSTTTTTTTTTTYPHDPTCFTADQKVMTPSGEVEISKLRAGDKVVSYNIKTNQFVISTVKYLIVHDGEDYFADGINHSFANNYNQDPLIDLSVETKEGQITNTQVIDIHPYYDPVTKLYREIKYFNVGDGVQTSEGVGIIIGKSVLIGKDSSSSQKSTVVYNLELDGDYHNFFVNGVLVHNYKY